MRKRLTNLRDKWSYYRMSRQAGERSRWRSGSTYVVMYDAQRQGVDFTRRNMALSGGLTQSRLIYGADPRFVGRVPQRILPIWRLPDPATAAQA